MIRKRVYSVGSLWRASLSLSIGYLFNYFALESDLNWTRDLYLKKTKIASEYSGKGRIFIFGGSGTHYSVDTTIVESELGQPVFNMGLHAGLGLHIILELAVKEARKGDIIVFAPEYGLLKGKGSGWLSSSFAVSIGEPGLAGVGLEEKVKELINGGCMSLRTFGKSVWKLFFKVKGRPSYKVDARGNAVEFMKGNPTPTVISDPGSDYALGRLRIFKQNISGAGAKLIFSLPSVLIAKNDGVSLKNIEKMVEKLTNVAPTIYDDNYNTITNAGLFSDSQYHLNKTERSIASQKLAQELKKYIRNTQSDSSRTFH